MTPFLTPEQATALHAGGDAPMQIVDPTTQRVSTALRAAQSSPSQVVDPATNRRYVIVDADDFARLEDANAIRRGISQMEAGLGQPSDEAMNEVRALLRQRQ